MNQSQTARSSPSHDLSDPTPRVVVDLLGTVSHARRGSLLSLACALRHSDIGALLVSVEAAEVIDSPGATALLEMLEYLRQHGTAAYLEVGRVAIQALLEAGLSKSGDTPLVVLANQWLDTR